MKSPPIPLGKYSIPGAWRTAETVPRRRVKIFRCGIAASAPRLIGRCADVAGRSLPVRAPALAAGNSAPSDPSDPATGLGARGAGPSASRRRRRACRGRGREASSEAPHDRPRWNRPVPMRGGATRSRPMPGRPSARRSALRCGCTRRWKGCFQARAPRRATALARYRMTRGSLLSRGRKGLGDRRPSPRGAQQARRVVAKFRRLDMSSFRGGVDPLRRPALQRGRVRGASCPRILSPTPGTCRCA